MTIHGTGATGPAPFWTVNRIAGAVRAGLAVVQIGTGIATAYATGGLGAAWGVSDSTSKDVDYAKAVADEEKRRSLAAFQDWRTTNDGYLQQERSAVAARPVTEYAAPTLTGWWDTPSLWGVTSVVKYTVELPPAPPAPATPPTTPPATPPSSPPTTASTTGTSGNNEAGNEAVTTQGSPQPAPPGNGAANPPANADEPPTPPGPGATRDDWDDFLRDIGEDIAQSLDDEVDYVQPPPVDLALPRVEIAAPPAQAPNAALDISSMTKATADSLIQDGLASSHSVMNAGDEIQYLVVPGPGATLVYQRASSRTFVPMPPGPGGWVTTQLDSYRLIGRFPPGMPASAIIDLLQSQEQIGRANAIAGTIEFALHLTPGGGTADGLINGHATYGELAMNAAADGLLFAGWAAKAFKFSHRTVASIRVGELLVDGTAVAGSVKTAIEVALDDDPTTPAFGAAAGEAFLRIAAAALANRDLATSAEARQLQLLQGKLASQIELAGRRRTRILELATPDPATGQIREHEARAAVLFEELTGRRLRRRNPNRPAESAGDYFDTGNGLSHDILFSGVKPQHFRREQAIAEVDRHLREYDRVIVDYTHLTPAQRAEIKSHIAQLPENDRRRIIEVGD